MGSRVAPYQKHQDKDTSSTNAGSSTVVYYSNITAMPAYVAKSVEELRWEDYSAGVKNATSAPPPAAAAAAPAAGAFGGAFGAAAAGSSPAFGASAPFGSTTSECIRLISVCVICYVVGIMLSQWVKGASLGKLQRWCEECHISAAPRCCCCCCAGGRSIWRRVWRCCCWQ
jgi:hypothetical protein